ncbi:hypothetical protein RJZ56_006634 [Blastomyces dermatitidis]
MIKGQIASGYDVVSRSCMSSRVEFFGRHSSSKCDAEIGAVAFWPRGGNRCQLVATCAIPDGASAAQHRPGPTALGGVGPVWLASLKLWLEHQTVRFPLSALSILPSPLRSSAFPAPIEHCALDLS